MDAATASIAPHGSKPPASPTSPILEALSRIEARLDRLEDAAQQSRRAIGGTLAGLTDTLDHAAETARARGIDLDERVRLSLAVLERATQPATLQALERVLAWAPTAPGTLAMLVDSLDGAIGRLAARGVEPDRALGNLMAALELLTSDAVLELLRTTMERAPALHALVASRMLDPDVIAVLARSGEALRTAATEPGEGVGAFGMLRALGDPDMRSATGFLLRFARAFGRSQDRPTAAAIPERATAAQKDERP
ncbi:MAG: DUF1641 domain-containing protein [Deltaproteobacteria bacterium]|nr:DUF1641 domain-containing protein [Deltaproteobacteria bacterium]MBK8714697.1 DUF1641 domain-containing protein [Deltaproteobacteria bacterium]MBP7289254.1 DUF1641 domain-containing protein [Nannocystaceae bacterium]